MKAEVRNPSGALTDCLVTDKSDGTYSVEYTPFENGDAAALPENLTAVQNSTIYSSLCRC